MISQRANRQWSPQWLTQIIIRPEYDHVGYWIYETLPDGKVWAVLSRTFALSNIPVGMTVAEYVERQIAPQPDDQAADPSFGF